MTHRTEEDEVPTTQAQRYATEQAADVCRPITTLVLARGTDADEAAIRNARDFGRTVVLPVPLVDLEHDLDTVAAWIREEGHDDADPLRIVSAREGGERVDARTGCTGHTTFMTCSWRNELGRTGPTTRLEIRVR